MKLVKNILILCAIATIQVNAIRLPMACTLTALNTALTCVSMQKCGVHLPEMTMEMATALSATALTTSSGSTFWWLYKRTPQGRMRDASKEILKINTCLVSGLKDTSEESLDPSNASLDAVEARILKCAERVNAREPFPLIKTANDFERYDDRVNKIKQLLEKAKSDIRPGEQALLKRHDDIESRAEKVGNVVKDMLVTLKKNPEYAKHLKYYNDMHAQQEQEKALKAQAQAQTQIAWASWFSAATKVVKAAIPVPFFKNPFKR